MTSLPKAVFFDWDGTLVESLKFIYSAHNHVRVHFGFPEWTFDEYKDNMKYSSVELYPKVYGDKSADAMDVLAKFMEGNHLKNLVTMDGATDLLDALHQANIPMGVVSNKRQAFLVREVTHLGWDKYFKAIVGAGVATRDKPEGDPLVLALNNAGLQPGPDVLYVGDTETDLLCAGAAGCKTAFLYYSQPNNPLIQKHNPQMVAKDCEDLAVALFPAAKQHKLVP